MGGATEVTRPHTRKCSRAQMANNEREPNKQNVVEGGEVGTRKAAESAAAKGEKRERQRSRRTRGARARHATCAKGSGERGGEGRKVRGANAVAGGARTALAPSEQPSQDLAARRARKGNEADSAEAMSVREMG